MRQKRIWVATFDGASARVFRYDGSPRGLEEIVGERRSGPHKPHFEERAGRVYSSVGPGRSSVEPHSDAERELEDVFAASLAERLAGKLTEGAFDELIVAAAPRALGAFRAAASRPLAEKVTREVHGDYVNSDQSQLLNALTDLTHGGVLHEHKRLQRIGDALAAALDLDMTRHWEPTQDFWEAAPKSLAIAALETAPSVASLGEEERKGMISVFGKMKKVELARTAAQALKDTGWLPEILITPTREGAFVVTGQGESALREGDPQAA